MVVSVRLLLLVLLSLLPFLRILSHRFLLFGSIGPGGIVKVSYADSGLAFGPHRPLDGGNVGFLRF